MTFVPFVPHVELSEQEISIYKTALLKLKANNSQDTVNFKKQAAVSIEQSYEEFLNQQTGVSYLTIDTSFKQYISDEPTNIIEPRQPVLFESELRRAEFNQHVSKVCNSFGKIQVTNEELDLLANYIEINGVKSYLYIRTELERSTADEQIASTIESAISKFIIDLLLKNLYTE